MPSIDTEPHYRFVVKCHREFNARIEKAAKAEGVTPTTYVQNHFNEIFGPVITEKATKPAPVKQDGRCKPPAVLSDEARTRLLDVLKSFEDENKRITMSYQVLARAAELTNRQARDGINELVTAGDLFIVKDSARGHKAIYALKLEASDV